MERPWGEYVVLDETAPYKLKRVVVNPGGHLSHKIHSRRAEHSVVIAGQATCTIDGETFRVRPRGSVDISLGAAHRLATRAPSRWCIEVQHGDYFGEDGIIRLSDDYGRSAEATGSPNRAWATELERRRPERCGCSRRRPSLAGRRRRDR